MSQFGTTEPHFGEIGFAELLDRSRSGDSVALGQLWERYNPQLIAFLRSLGMSEADDIASETWISVARALKTFDGRERNFRMLLFHIARRRVTDHLRKFYRDRSVATGDEPFTRLPSSTTVTIGEGSVDDALELLRMIPGAQAEVIALRILADLDVGEVAEIVGRSEGSVRVLCHRGLNKLNEILSARQDATSQQAVRGQANEFQLSAGPSARGGDCR